MRTYTAVGLLLGLCLVGGCGGTTVKTVTQPPARANAATQPPPVLPPAQKICKLLQPARVCKFLGRPVNYTPRQETLQLKTLTAKLVGVRAAPVTASREYLIATLNIKNDSTSPHTFGSSGTTQTFLVAGGKEHNEAVNAEKNDPNSFVTKNEPIQPGASKTADVIFAVPPSVATKVIAQKDGGLFIGNLGDDLSKHLRSRVGLIALMTQR